jgi:hypothetical protein
VKASTRIAAPPALWTMVWPPRQAVVPGTAPASPLPIRLAAAVQENALSNDPGIGVQRRSGDPAPLARRFPARRACPWMRFL